MEEGTEFITKSSQSNCQKQWYLISPLQETFIVPLCSLKSPSRYPQTNFESLFVFLDHTNLQMEGSGQCLLFTESFHTSDWRSKWQPCSCRGKTTKPLKIYDFSFVPDRILLTRRIKAWNQTLHVSADPGWTKTVLRFPKSNMPRKKW